jgi:hypothetical protein
MTPISTPAVPPVQARAPQQGKPAAPARPSPVQSREVAQVRAVETPRGEAPPEEQEPSAAEEELPAEPPKPPKPAGPSLLRRTLGWMFARPKKRTAAADRTRSIHASWRRSALYCYGLIVAATLAGQLYSANPLGVYVKVQHVDLPVSTLVLVRNDSRFPWKHVRIRLNGIYTATREEIEPGESVPLDLDKAFAITDGNGRVLRRPAKNLAIESFALDCNRGHYETELR